MKIRKWTDKSKKSLGKKFMGARIYLGAALNLEEFCYRWGAE